MQRGHQKTVTVKLYPEEIEALEIIRKMSGMEGKSTALREFMKIWVEVAIVVIESKSTLKGGMAWLKASKRLVDQMKAIQEGTKNEKLLEAHNLEVLKKSLGSLRGIYVRP